MLSLYLPRSVPLAEPPANADAHPPRTLMRIRGTLPAEAKPY
jgi:hypothetical protein